MKSLIVTTLALFALSTSVASADECRFSGESDSTSLAEHFTSIKQALSGKDLQRYFLSCGFFIGSDRYYSDLVTPESQTVLNEIRNIQRFKSMALTKLSDAAASSENAHLGIVAIAGNWKNDTQFVTLLLSLLNSKNREVAYEAAGSLKGTTSPVAISVLVNMLDSSNAAVRYIAAVALEGTTVPEARAALMKLRTDSDLGVRAQGIIGTL